MAGTIKVPGIGEMPKGQVYAIGAGAAGIVLFAYARARGAATAPTVVDPNVDSGGLIGDPANGGGYVNPAPSGAVPDPTADSAPTTNAAWSQRVQEALAFSFDATLIQTTLGKYLDRQPLTTSEQLLIRTAWGFVGRPPEGTYPIIPATAPPAPPAPPAPAKPRYVMKWQSTQSHVSQTLAQKQTGQATQAAKMGVWKPSGASLKSVIGQAAIRSGKSPNSIIKPGQWVVLYMPVPA